MFSKLSNSFEKLHHLRDRAAEIGDAAMTRASDVAQAKLKGRGAVVSLGVAGVMAAGLIAGASALVNSVEASATESATETVAAADAGQRLQAATRADRSARTAPAAKAPATKTTTPKAPGKAAAAKKAAPKWVSPMPGTPLSSCFGQRWGMAHKGLDFAGNAGTRIRAVGAGRVFAAGWIYSGYGMSVVVNHGNGYLTHYAHASRLLVKPGQKVKPGQVLALEGSTGNSTGPHLHFEVHRGLWNQVNPSKWLRAHGVKIGC